MSTSRSLPTQDALVGGKYRLREVIGSGGVGTVYRAIHLWTEREVAIKILDPSLPHFDQLRDAFLREARATVQLDHPNVVDVLDMGEDRAGTTYMVMELLNGPTLRDMLLEQGRLSVSDTAAILLPLLDALEMAHQREIIHKDFKPENIILSVDAFDVMTPKLLDFGVAQSLRESRPRGLDTTRDVILGTPHYMSPEQAQNHRHLMGPQTDVWGVGVVWYECLTGRCPFDGDTPLEVLASVCEAPIDFEGLPEEQVPFLRSALERSTSKRTPNLSILRSQLEDSGALGPGSSVQRIAMSSRPSQNERPSYVRRTLQGVGTFESKETGPRAVQVDSELLTLPMTSQRKAALGGIALAIAVCAAAWWTIVGHPVETPAPVASTPPAGAQKQRAVEAEPNPEPEPEPEPTAEPEPQFEPEAELVPDEEAIDQKQLRSPALPAKAEPAPPATKFKPRKARVRKRPSSSPEYQKPPDLVTEW